MRHILKLTAVVALYALGSGLLIIGAPQAGLALGMTSQEIGMLGAGMPLGYVTGCLLFGRIFRKLAGKYVLLCGILATALAAGAMGQLVPGSALAAGMTHSAAVHASVAVQFLIGLASGAFWPFCSAWMLDFQDARLSKTTILRFYNVAWTSGTAAGMLTSGMLCKSGLVGGSFYLAGGLSALSLTLALIPPATRKSVDLDTTPLEPRARRIGAPLLLAAVLANLLVLVTRATIINNYAELNKFLNFEADRMGLLVASALIGQLFGFLIGGIYEPLLGRRTMYTLIAVAILAINLTVAYAVSLPLLMLAMVCCGLVAAMAFQAAIIAATECFRLPRTGTTFHEAMVGLGGMGTFVAGTIVESAKAAQVAPLTALRTPFLALAATAVVVLALQLILVTSRNKDRILLPAEPQVGRLPS